MTLGSRSTLQPHRSPVIPLRQRYRSALDCCRASFATQPFAHRCRLLVPAKPSIALDGAALKHSIWNCALEKRVKRRRRTLGPPVRAPIPQLRPLPIRQRTTRTVCHPDLSGTKFVRFAQALEEIPKTRNLPRSARPPIQSSCGDVGHTYRMLLRTFSALPRSLPTANRDPASIELSHFSTHSSGEPLHPASAGHLTTAPALHT
jgi:hypothetical protein